MILADHTFSFSDPRGIVIRSKRSFRSASLRTDVLLKYKAVILAVESAAAYAFG